MFIVSKNRNSIINTAQVTSIYVGADNCTIKADYQNGSGCQLGRYSSETAAYAAIELIAENLNKCDVCFMPKDNSVDAKLNNGIYKQHNIDGKKTKGHGGS